MISVPRCISTSGLFFSLPVVGSFFVTMTLKDILLTGPSFIQENKAIDPAIKSLTAIANLHTRYPDQEMVYVKCDIFSTYFQYIGPYRKYLTAMVELGLLEINESYIKPTLPDKSDGRPKRYKVTDVGMKLLAEGKYIENHNILTVPSEAKKVEKSIRDRRVMEKNYEDFVLNYIQDSLIHLSISPEYHEVVKAKYESEKSWFGIENCLHNILTKRFKILEPNESDSRICTDFNLLKSDVRFRLKYKNMIYRAQVDIRSALSTFLSAVILRRYRSKKEMERIGKNEKKTHSQNSLNSAAFLPEAPLNPHMLDEEALPEAILEEHNRWVSEWTDEEKDPRKYIETGSNDPKQALIETFNGSTKYPLVGQWFASNYPLLYDIWKKTDKKTIYCEYATVFESPLMRNEMVFSTADAMGIKLGPEYDGYGIFAHESSTTLASDVNAIAQELRFLSNRWWGIPVVIKQKILQ